MSEITPDEYDFGEKFENRLIVNSNSNELSTPQEVSEKVRKKIVVKFTRYCMAKNIFYLIIFVYSFITSIYTSSFLIILFPEMESNISISAFDVILIKAWIIFGFIYALNNFSKLFFLFFCCYSDCIFRDINKSLKILFIIFSIIDIIYLAIYINGFIDFIEIIQYCNKQAITYYFIFNGVFLTFYTYSEIFLTIILFKKTCRKNK